MDKMEKLVIEFDMLLADLLIKHRVHTGLPIIAKTSQEFERMLIAARQEDDLWAKS